MSEPRIGALFAGYGGLDMAVQSVLGGDIAWVSDIDPGACAILAHHHPGAPNLGDITKVDWSTVEPVDVLTGGYPCQPFSQAGRREGAADRRHLWPYVATAVGTLRPEWVYFENVRGHLTLGFDEVLRDLSLLNYDVAWTVMRASDVGAPHSRARIFILGRNCGRQLRSRSDRRGGLRRDRRDWRNDAGAPQGLDDRQGSAGASSPGIALRRIAQAGPGGDADSSGVPHLATERTSGSGTAGPLGSAASSEVRSRAGRAGLPMDGGLGGAPSEWASALDCRDEAEGARLPGADSGGQSSRPRPVDTEWPDAFRCPTPGFLVRAGGRPVRPSRVHGPLSNKRLDGRPTPLRPELATLLPTPRASDGEKGGPGRRGSSGDLMLPSAVALLPTPDASAHKYRLRGDSQQSRGLAAMAARGELLLPTPAVNDMGEGKTVGERDAWTARMKAEHGNGNGHGKSLAIEAQRLLPTPSVADVEGGRKGRSGARSDELLLNGIAAENRWGEYAPAIARWERLTRPAPEPTQPSSKGKPQLAPRFVEWMQGLPAGHVTDPAIYADLTDRHGKPLTPSAIRNLQLRALGNGVVWQQGAAALRWLLRAREWAASREVAS